jgi:hypothetical protein
MNRSFISFVSVSCLVGFCIQIVVAQEKRDIWGDAIMKQPFDKEPFRQIKVADWLHDTVGCGYTLSVMDSKARAKAAAHGVSISEVGFVDPFYAYYDSK